MHDALLLAYLNKTVYNTDTVQKAVLKNYYHINNKETIHKCPEKTAEIRKDEL